MIKDEYHQDVKRQVYVETTVISYLASRPSRDIIVAGRQQLTLAWWETRRFAFDLVISQLVLDEAAAGDPTAAERRMRVTADIPLLDITPAAAALAAALIEEVPLPPQAAADGAHIAIAACHKIDFLVTWNVAHIANAVLRRRVEAVCRKYGHAAPILCTPDELLEDPDA